MLNLSNKLQSHNSTLKFLTLILIASLLSPGMNSANNKQAAENQGSLAKRNLVQTLLLPEQVGNSEIGIGFFKPNFYENPTLYFYGDINLEKGLIEHMPMDSLVFTQNQYGEISTSYAPPWLYPEHLKLDYGVMYFKVLGIGHDFVKVIANKANAQVSYVDKNHGQFISWPEFLMSINSVEFKEGSSGKVFSKPFEHAGEIAIEYAFIQPLMVHEEWLYGKFVDEQLKEKGKGWIMWRKGNKLYINYSLFS